MNPNHRVSIDSAIVPCFTAMEPRVCIFLIIYSVLYCCALYMTVLVPAVHAYLYELYKVLDSRYYNHCPTLTLSSPYTAFKGKSFTKPC